MDKSDFKIEYSANLQCKRQSLGAVVDTENMIITFPEMLKPLFRSKLGTTCDSIVEALSMIESFPTGYRAFCKQSLHWSEREIDEALVALKKQLVGVVPERILNPTPPKKHSHGVWPK